MDDLNRFASGIDNYMLTHKNMQPEDKNLVTLELEFLMSLANSTINSEYRKKLEKKLAVIKDVSDL